MKKRGNNRLLQTFVKPVIPEFKLKDALQVIIGASILAVPVGFTQETWDLGASSQLPFINVFGLFLLSIFFISLFTLYHYHRRTEVKHLPVFFKRVISTYVFSFLIVAVILSLIQRGFFSPGIDFITAVKTTVIVTFPSSLSGTIADTIK